MSDLVRRTFIKDGKIINQTVQDHSAILDWNREARASRPEHGKYKGNLVHVGKIGIEFIDKMANGQCCPDGSSYRMLSPDPEERRRAVLHIQSEHKHWLTVDGKPFAKKRVLWR